LFTRQPSMNNVDGNSRFGWMLVIAGAIIAAVE
jgi:hypothetical protein